MVKLTLDDFENKLVELIIAAADANLDPEDVTRILTDQAGSVTENAPTQKVTASDVDPTAGLNPDFKWDGNG